MALQALRRAVSAAFKATFAYPGAGGASSGSGAYPLWQGPITGGAFLSQAMPGSDIDYAAAAGTPWFNPVVMAAVKWTVRNFNEAPLVVRRKTAEPNEDDPIVEGHPLTALYNKPCPGFDAGRLSAGYLTSRLVDGNGYLIKLRNDAGRPVQLHYAPHFLMEPRWTGRQYLTAYEYRVDDKKVYYDPADVVTFQDGVDPDNLRKGMSGLKAASVDLVTDNEAAYYSCAILKNMGIPGAVLSPAPNADAELPSDFAQKVKSLWGERFGGDGRGKPLVFDFPVQVAFPDASPEKMSLDKLRQIPVDRVLATLGINSTVLHLQIEGQPKFANYGEAREAATEEYLIPLWRDIAGVLTRELLPDFSDDPDEYVDFDTSHVRALSEDEDAIAVRNANKAKAAQALVAVGYDPAGVLEAVGLPAMPHVAPPANLSDAAGAIEGGGSSGQELPDDTQSAGDAGQKV